jgi:tetratricopeptide (TPR) repeat protein
MFHAPAEAGLRVEEAAEKLVEIAPYGRGSETALRRINRLLSRDRRERSPARRYILLLLMIAPLALAQSVVVGTRNTDGKISFEAVEDFQINQSRKIRLLPEQKDDVDPNALRKLNKIDLAQAGLIRNDGTGRLVSLNGPGAPRDIVVPENLNIRTSTPVKDVPGRLGLSLVRNKKTKQADLIAPELFVVVLFGNTPDEAVRDFVGKDWAFLNPDEQLQAMRGFVASFPSSPAAKVFRDSIERRITAGLARFEEGGPFSDILVTRGFSELARQAFPGDAPLAALDDRVAGRIKFVSDRPKLLRSLAALGDWDTLLDRYQDFERYESSFPEMQSLHREALEESVRMHARRARALEQRSDFARAAREASAALLRDPSNQEIRKLLGDENVLASQGEALANASRRKVLPRGMPADIRFGNALNYADRAIADKDFKKAQQSIQDAERENPGAPEVILLRAKLLAAEGRNAEAIPLLDQYDRLVANSTEREKGYDVRRQVLYDLDKLKESTRQQIAELLKDGQYSKLDEVLRKALIMDGEDPEFLYQGGVVAAVLRDAERAKIILAEFIAHSNAIGVDPRQRERARRILSIVKEQKPAAGRKPEGLFYDPQSLAFQIPLDSVTASKVHMAFNWANGRLDSIRTTFDDDKGAQLYRALVVAGAADSGAVGAASTENPGNFFFEYHPSGALREVLPKKYPPTAQKAYSVHIAHDAKGRALLIDDDGHPEIVLPDHPYIDPAVLAVVEGAPVTSVISGNSFFNPFLWDGVHAFTVQYDRLGRAESAQEWNADNLVRFSWDGNQLTAIRAYRKGSDAPYYQRTITYSGSTITGEDYSANGRSGKIKYIYTNGKNLQQIKIENDGKEWTARPRS